MVDIRQPPQAISTALTAIRAVRTGVPMLNPGEDLLGMAEVAAYLGVSRQMVHKRMKNKQILRDWQPRRISERVFVFDRFLLEKYVGNAAIHKVLDRRDVSDGELNRVYKKAIEAAEARLMAFRAERDAKATA